MNRVTLKYLLVLLMGLPLISACDQFEADVMPVSFEQFELYPDEVYMVNDGAGWKFMLTPLVNDSLKTEVTLSFGKPLHGQLVKDWWGENTVSYVPQNDFFGLDSLTYTVCSDKVCKTEKMRFIVEEPLNQQSCATTLGADSLFTSLNTPKEIKIFANDVFCGPTPYAPVVVHPVNGKIRFYDYMGSYKNPTFIYTPNKNFVGDDAFTYRVYTNEAPAGYLEMVVKVKVTP